MNRLCLLLAVLMCAAVARAQYVTYWFQGWQRQGDAADAQAYFMRPGTNIVFTYASNRVYINASGTITNIASTTNSVYAQFATNWLGSNDFYFFLQTNLNTFNGSYTNITNAPWQWGCANLTNWCLWPTNVLSDYITATNNLWTTATNTFSTSVSSGVQTNWTNTWTGTNTWTKDAFFQAKALFGGMTASQVAPTYGDLTYPELIAKINSGYFSVGEGGGYSVILGSDAVGLRNRNSAGSPRPIEIIGHPISLACPDTGGIWFYSAFGNYAGHIDSGYHWHFGNQNPSDFCGSGAMSYMSIDTTNRVITDAGLVVQSNSWKDFPAYLASPVWSSGMNYYASSNGTAMVIERKPTITETNLVGYNGITTNFAVVLWTGSTTNVATLYFTNGILKDMLGGYFPTPPIVGQNLTDDQGVWITDDIGAPIQVNL